MAALTHDMVWLEKQSINGESVLVPVLYLAQAKDRLAPTGALLQGTDVNLISGQDLKNSGTLKGSHNLQAKANNLYNNGGLIEAGHELNLIAQKTLHNQQGGIISGETVNLYAENNLINERSIATQTLSGTGFSQTTSVLNSAAKIEVSGNLNLIAGNDIKNIGSSIQSSGDTQLIAGNNLIIAAQQEVQQSARQDKRHSWNNSSVTQYGSSIQSQGTLTAQAGQALIVEASQVKAAENLSLKSGGDILISAAANEAHSEYRYRSNRKKITAENTHIEQQAAQIEAGQNLAIEANNNLIISASQLKVGENAYLYAGDQLALLAAQNQDYSLYEKNQKGALGSKQQRRDEQTDIKNIGTQINSGGDLILQSQGNQLYQSARLESAGNIEIDSGAQITFEATKDLHQESHTKSKNNALWQSMQGKGRTGETLNQTALIAKGELLIKAVDGLNIDIKEINQQSVSQTIDAMVKADPNLAWLKQAEERGDINWRQVKEVHDSFHYKHQGMGGAAMIIVAIVVTYLTWGAGSALVGTMNIANATASATAAAAANAAISAAASNAAISTINNQGKLDTVFKDVTSSDALKSYLAAAITAGLIQGAGGILPDSITGASNASLEAWQNLPGFVQNELFNQATAAVVNKAIFNQDIEVSALLQATLANSFAAAGFKLVGDISLDYGLEDGSASKVAMHALMGGLAAEAAGGEFKTGALAAGANELLVDYLGEHYKALPKDEKDRLLEMNSKIIGVLAATAQGNIDPSNLQTAAWVAENGTKYNRFLHHIEQEWIEKNAKDFAEKEGITEQEARERLAQQALRQVDFIWRSRLADGDDTAAQQFLNATDLTFTNEYGQQQTLFTVTGNQFSRMEMYADQADLQFYKNYVQNGVQRDLLKGPTKELKDIAIEYKDNVTKLCEMYKTHPEEVKQAIVKAYEELDVAEAVTDGTIKWFIRSGNAIGERSAVGFNSDLQEMLNDLHGADVSVAQKIIGISGTALTATEVLGVGKAVAIAEKLAKAGGEATVEGAKNIVKNLKPKPALTPATFKNKEAVSSASKTGISWDKGTGIGAQGLPWEDFLEAQGGVGSRLPRNFKTFDFMDWETGVATSAKTLDTLTETRINKPKQIYNTLKGYINKVDKFPGYRLSGVNLSSQKISSRVIQLAIPNGTNSAGWEQIDHAIDYAKKLNIKLKVTVDK